MYEFWIDVRCTGELRKTYSEICIRRFEVVDTGFALPAPMKIGATPVPMMPDQDDQPVDDDEGSAESPKPKKKGKRKTSASEEETPPRLSKKNAQRKALEEDLAEDISCNIC